MKINNNNNSYLNTQKHNAYIYNKHLDTGFTITRESALEAQKHIEDCINNPTIGLLARKKYRTHNLPEFCYKNNYQDLLLFDEIDVATKSFDDKFSKIYPKTGKARKFLIDRESIKLDSVKKISKKIDRRIFKILGKIFK